MTIQETTGVRKHAVSDIARVIGILAVVVVESIALFCVPDLTVRGALGIFAASWAASAMFLVV